MRSRIVSLLVFICTVSLVAGCGGGGGGGAAITPPLDTTATKDFLAQAIAGRTDDLLSNNQTYGNAPGRLSPLQYASSIPQNAIVTDLGVGQTRVTFQAGDIFTFGNVTRTYAGGSTVISTYDLFGNLTDSFAQTNNIIFLYENLQYSFTVNGSTISITENGVLGLSGFVSGLFRVGAVALQINFVTSAHTLTWTVPETVVTYGIAGYPLAGETSGGSLTLDGQTINYLISYNGGATATVALSGAAIETFTMDMSTGLVM